MAIAQIQLPTPLDTPKNMEQDEPSPASYAHHSTSWTPVDTGTPIPTNPSRKRSRDDTAFEGEDITYFPAMQVNTPAPIPEEEPIYGEGMVLLNPHTGISISAESQTGTWYEEKAEEEAKAKAEKAAVSFRPTLPGRKSIRLSQSSIRSQFDPPTINAPASPPKSSSSHPEIDDATIALGIGWAKLSSEDEAIQAAARGWARYLENHYTRHVHGAEILLKSSGLNAYLVGSHEGFFLFREDLLEGRLVSRTWQGCLQNLRSQPMVFEGEEVISAERTPGPEAKQFELQSTPNETMQNWADSSRLNGNKISTPQTLGDSGGGMDID